MAGLVRDTQSALALLGDRDHLAAMHRALAEVSERERVHGLLHGVATRLLADAQLFGPGELERRVSRQLSPAVAALDAAAFVEGFLAGSGTVLVHDRELLDVVDGWVSGLAADAFSATVPLLRRTFGGFDPAERRQLGLLLDDEAVAAPFAVGADVDPARAAAALVTVRAMLGVAP